MSTAEDSDCEVQPILRAAIGVKVGNINVTAILDDTCAINAVHPAVFKRICEEDDIGNISIELDISIDGRSATAVFRIIPQLWTDMVLGEEFFISVKAHIHLELRLLKWSCEDELVITDMVGNDDNFRALSGGSSGNETKSSEKKETESAAPQEEPSITYSKKKRNRKKAKKSKKNNDPSSSQNPIDLQLQQLTIHESNSAKKNPKKNEFIKIFIAERELWDMRSGECLAYYGIYSSQVDRSVVKGEVLDTKEKYPLGFHMEALHEAFGEADEHGITHLHILSENQDAIKLMIAHQKKYDKYGVMEPEQYPPGVGLYRPDDFINYYTACYGIPGFEKLKFEYVPFTDETHEEFMHVRNLIEEYIETTPM